MKNSIKLPLFLLTVVILILGYIYIFNSDKVVIEENGLIQATLSQVQNSNIDISETLFRIEEDKDYYLLKDLNFYLSSYYEGVNSGDINMELLNSEYVEFMRLDKDEILKPYSKFNVVAYDVISYERINGGYVIHLHFRESGDDKRYLKSFSISGRSMSDRPFIRVEEIFRVTESSDYSINVTKKAVFSDYEIYQIDIENLSEGSIYIDGGMFGFNAIKGENKYYHTLESTKLPYELVKGEKRSFLIRFDCLNPEMIQIIIDGEEIRIY